MYFFLYKEMLVLHPLLKGFCLTSVPPGQMNGNPLSVDHGLQERAACVLFLFCL